MTSHRTDLTLESMLTDPMIRKAMRADHVDPLDFETLLRSAARKLETNKPRAPLAALMAPRNWPASFCGCGA